MFLTEGGNSPLMDIRATSIQEAIKLAKRWNLLGIVSEAVPFVQCPRIVNVVKEEGLMCVTYGSLNNDPDLVRLLMKNGVDAVIADSVLTVRKSLTSSEI